MRPKKMTFPNCTQEELIAEALQRSSEIFPAEDNHDRSWLPPKSIYVFFPGIDYFRKGIITPDMIHALQNGANMLSVGSGDGHLERLLTDGFHIPRESIIVSDLSLHPQISTRGFKTYEFDMTRPWPSLEERFNYILFPQSLGVALLHFPGGPTYRFWEYIQPEIQRIIAGEQSQDAELVKTVIGMDVPIVSAQHQVMRNAINNLKPGGEIRICYGLHEQQHQAYLMLKLQEELPGVTFPEPRGTDNFTIRLPKRET